MFRRLILISSFLLVSGVSAIGASSAVMASDVEDLSAKLQSHQRLSAKFQQYSLGEGSSREEVSEGVLWLEGSEKFRWETEKPFPQVIVSDGISLWVYDPDLEQVTRRPLGEGEVMTPARVLGGSLSQLQSYFDVALIDAGASNTLYELKPLQADQAEFKRLRMLFTEDRLAELLIEDTLGQRSLIMLSEISFPESFDATIFQFEPPVGVDLIEVGGS